MDRKRDVVRTIWMSFALSQVQASCPNGLTNGALKELLGAESETEVGLNDAVRMGSGKSKTEL